MPLSPGTRLGPYEIVATVGAGGMGEVYRAKDPRLKRDVAIKVLPSSFSQDADRLRRFEQEAQAAGDFAGRPDASNLVSPDGTRIAVRGPDRKRYFYPLAGGEPTPIPGTEGGDFVMQFAAEGRHIFTQQSSEVPAEVSRVDLATGKKEPWRTIVPSDPAGVSGLFVTPAPDGSSYMYGFSRSLSELYLLQNVQ